MGTQKLARISQNESSKKDEVSYFLTDALGSATFITYHHTASPNDALRITESLLDPWGNSVKNGFFNQTKVQDFTGKAVDEASSLYDFGFRFYDPFLATWIGKDLVPADHSAPLTLNPFLFCLNNPVRFVDPDGRDYEAGPMQGWSFESAFSFAFQMDYGESGKTFVEKAPDRIREWTPAKIYTAVMLETTGAGDICRVVGGIDPYTFEKLPPGERLENAAQSVVFMKADKLAEGVGAAAKLMGAEQIAPQIENGFSAAIKSLELSEKLWTIYKGVTSGEKK